MDPHYLWWRDGIIYQIYPRSFADSNADGIGDLNGIRAHLDYLSDLGVDALWLSPIYPSPDVDFGYDVSNYIDIDPKMGSLADFDRLVEEAHRRDLHIVMDLVLNHTSDQHPWFKQSRLSHPNPYSDWYLWRDPAPGGKPPNNWASIFGGSGWKFDAGRGQYYFHMFAEEQPDLNWRNPAVHQAILDVFRFWLERGVDGFRLDVFNAYFKHPDLLNNPPAAGIRLFERQRHIYDINQPEMVPLLKEIRQLLDSYPERYVVGETFLGNTEIAAEYCGDDRLHAAFNFDFAASYWSARRFRGALERWEKALRNTSQGAPEGGPQNGPQNGPKWPNYFLSNHDMTRAASRYCTGEDDRRAKVAAALLLTLRGTPFIYYGEEIGMRDLTLKRSQILDPVGKRYWPLMKGRDGCRGPMQWNSTHQAGFSTANPWLPLHPDYGLRNVAAQEGDPGSLLAFYQKLIALRRQTPALQRGSLDLVSAPKAPALAFLRRLNESGNQASVLVALNFSHAPQSIILEPLVSGQKWQLIFSSETSGHADFADARLTGSALTLAPDEVCLFIST
jgi:alpha-glucosidase